MKRNPVIIDVWPSGAPHANGITGPEITLDGKVGHISQAQLHVYSPDPENSWNAAIIIFPGGGFHAINIDSMGTVFANWLADRGITGIVVKYRTPNGIPEVVGEDALQALLLTHGHAKKWRIDPKKIGVCGFSIGGNTASWLCNTAPEEIRPEFQILFYPVESLKDDYTHVPTRENFLGKHPSPELIAAHSNEFHINHNVPPTFIALSDNDPVVPPIATSRYYTALKKNKIPACMYIFPTGGHGWTFDSDFEYIEMCKELLYKWLKSYIKL
ncbi:MAG: alpha/beta hydrolase [Bacteroidales bacterium]